MKSSRSLLKRVLDITIRLTFERATNKKILITIANIVIVASKSPIKVISTPKSTSIYTLMLSRK